MLENTPLLSSNDDPLLSSNSKISIDSGLDAALIVDPLYKELLAHYQNAQWKKCQLVMKTLLEKYPKTPKLDEIRADVEMKLMLRGLGRRDVKDRVASGAKSFFIILSVVLFILALAGVLVYQMANSYAQNLENSRNLAVATQKENLKSLENQARQSLNAGQPDTAVEIIVQIEAIDPKYPAIADLRKQTSDLNLLVHLYEQAMQEMSAKQYAEAMPIFNQILEKNPSFRDVRFQINRINQINHLNTLLTQADSAYQKGDWLDAIPAFEEAISLDSSVSTPEIKDELLYSYLKSIVETLSKQDPTIPELERSGGFYQKAISLIPQNRNYLAARENLQQLSLELLVSKYFQIAKLVLRDPNQSPQAVDQAINFLQQSLRLRPDNPPVKAELDKAIIYQKAYSAFNVSNWDSAIKNLNDLIKFDESYPNGMGQVLLYESYAMLGQKFLSGGFYLDARANLEKAEFIAWNQTNNKMRLFQVQLNLGYVLGKLENYKDGVSYFDYALKVSNALTSPKMDAAFITMVQNGQDLNKQGKYEESYKVYLEALKNIDKLYRYTDVLVAQGDSLVYIAETNASTIQAIRQYNKVDFPLTNQALTLSVPSLP